ncbi:MAG TPA: ribosome recycling factor [Candidatus Saccharimonadales bacterium]|nr:ribosome recycling factor [Candidatus Saccharimonadales bacterium]
MDQAQIIRSAKTKFTQAIAHFQDELKKLRTGRAHSGMLDGVMVEAYGTQMPLIQVGTITVPESQLLQISPFDPSNLQAISTAIRDNQSLGLNPMDDGRVVRIQIPPLTEERRKDMAKLLGGKVEDCMIAMRGARHEALHEADQAKQARKLTEDDLTSIKKQLDEQMAKHKTEIDNLAKTKEQEIMTV